MIILISTGNFKWEINKLCCPN